MKGVIDENGNLYIRRGGRQAPQLCPYRDQPCGDQCPKFREPCKIHPTPKIDFNGCILELCQNERILFTELVDERK